jgi:hypothetical protein
LSLNIPSQAQSTHHIIAISTGPSSHTFGFRGTGSGVDDDVEEGDVSSTSINDFSAGLTTSHVSFVTIRRCAKPTHLLCCWHFVVDTDHGLHERTLLFNMPTTRLFDRLTTY